MEAEPSAARVFWENLLRSKNAVWSLVRNRHAMMTDLWCYSWCWRFGWWFHWWLLVCMIVYEKEGRKVGECMRDFRPLAPNPHLQLDRTLRLGEEFMVICCSQLLISRLSTEKAKAGLWITQPFLLWAIEAGDREVIRKETLPPRSCIKQTIESQRRDFAVATMGCIIVD